MIVRDGEQANAAQNTCDGVLCVVTRLRDVIAAVGNADDQFGGLARLGEVRYVTGP